MTGVQNTLSAFKTRKYIPPLENNHMCRRAKKIIICWDNTSEDHCFALSFVCVCRFCTTTKLVDNYMRIRRLILPNQHNKNNSKNNVEEYIFGYIALHIECWFNNNSLLQSYFLTFLSIGSTSPRQFLSLFVYVLLCMEIFITWSHNIINCKLCRPTMFM